MIDSFWPVFRLHDVVRFQEGPGILAKDFASQGVPLVRLAGLGGYEASLQGCNHIDANLVDRKWSHFKLKRGDILVSTSASFGRPAVVGTKAEGAIFYTGIIRFRSSSADLDDGYLKTFLGSRIFMDQSEAFASGSVIRHFGPSHLREMFIPLPPISVQRAIASIHAAFDDKIDLNRRMNETLEATARAIFKDWFVDFGPTRAMMERRAPYLAPEVWSLFPDVLDNEGKPQGWLSGQLSDIAEVIMGASPNGDSYNSLGIGVPLVNGPVEFGEFFLQKSKWTTEPTRMSCSDDLIVCVRGSTTGRYAHADDEYCLGRGVCAIRAKSGIQAFVDCNIIDRMSELLLKTTGSVFPSLSYNDIRSFVMVIPSRLVLQAFCRFTDPLRDRIWSNVRENSTLTFLRDLLLPKLMSGEIRVTHAEKIAEAAQ